MVEEELERVYTVPLRRSTLRTPRRRRANRAVRTVQEFVARHMNTDVDRVWIDTLVNERIWGRGIEKPPARIRIKVIRFEDGVVEVSLPEE